MNNARIPTVFTRATSARGSRLVAAVIAAMLETLGATSAPTYGAPPVNDQCEDAAPIQGEGEFSFNLAEATPDHWPDCSYGAYPDSGNVWFTWTSTCIGTVTMDFCTGGTADAEFVNVYDTASCSDIGSNTELLCQNLLFNTVPCDSPQTFDAGLGGSYLVHLSRPAGVRGGAGTFRISCGEIKTPSCAIHPGVDTGFCSARGALDALVSSRETAVVADRFHLESDGYLSDLCWWGTYFNGTVGECDKDVPDEFRVTYYQDDCGLPGQVVGGPFIFKDGSLHVDGPARTGRKLMGTLLEFEYSAWHTMMILPGGQDYWIEITNSRAYDCLWYWETASSSRGVI